MGLGGLGRLRGQADESHCSSRAAAASEIANRPWRANNTGVIHAELANVFGL